MIFSDYRSQLASNPATENRNGCEPECDKPFDARAAKNKSLVKLTTPS